MSIAKCFVVLTGALWAMIVASPDTYSAEEGPARSFAARKQAVVDYLKGLREEGRFLAGVQVNEYEVFLKCDSMDRLVAMTGREQAVLGLELMFAQEYPPYRDYLVSHAVNHARQGGLVTMAWHQRNPIRVCPRGEFYDCSKTPMSADDLERVLTPGTQENALWLADVDAAAETLRRLQDEGVIVLFRPYHEMNGGWFWWGDKDAYPHLWDALADALETRHGLENILWVWSGDRRIENAERYWPVRHPPDIVGADVYEKTNDGPSFLDGAGNTKELAGDRPFAFTEIGRVPSGAVSGAVRPAWVLVWGGEFLNAQWAQAAACDRCNTEEETKAFFSRPALVALGDMPASVRQALSGGAVADAQQRPHCPSSLLER